MSDRCPKASENVYIEALKQQREFREAVGAKYSWFVHDTGFARLDFVRANGLILRDYEPYEIPDDLLAFRNGGCAILCFYPNGADLRPQSSQEPPYVRFAISSAVLPQDVGLDWSYQRADVQRQRQRNACLPLIEFCLKVIKELGSVASYAPVPAKDLLVCGKGCDPKDPTHWPLLLDTPNDEIWRYGIGAQ